MHVLSICLQRLLISGGLSSLTKYIQPRDNFTLDTLPALNFKEVKFGTLRPRWYHISCQDRELSLNKISTDFKWSSSRNCQSKVRVKGI